MQDKMSVTELVKKIVNEEVLVCLSTMMYELRDVAEQLDDYDTYLNLQTGVPDYQERVEDWLRNEASVSDLIELMDHTDTGSDIGEHIGYDSYVSEAEDQDLDPLDFEDWVKKQAKDGVPIVWSIKEELVTYLRLDDDWEKLCDYLRLETYESEVYEHWAVTRWLASKLESQGERVEEYMGMYVWGRCTTGQSITIDYVMEKIAESMNG